MRTPRPGKENRVVPPSSSAKTGRATGVRRGRRASTGPCRPLHRRARRPGVPGSAQSGESRTSRSQGFRSACGATLKGERMSRGKRAIREDGTKLGAIVGLVSCGARGEAWGRSSRAKIVEVPVGGSLARDSHKDMAEIVDGAKHEGKIAIRCGGFDAGGGSGRHFGRAVGGRGEECAEVAGIGQKIGGRPRGRILSCLREIKLTFSRRRAHFLIRATSQLR